MAAVTVVRRPAGWHPEELDGEAGVGTGGPPSSHGPSEATGRSAGATMPVT